MTADLLELSPPHQDDTSEPNPPAQAGPADFDWCEDSAILIESQRATAIHENQAGHVVIRQQDPVFEDDPYVLIAPEYLDRVIARLVEFRDAMRNGGR